MNTLRLKDALAKALENCRVKAALFTTFNFEPRFFENYVLPLLLPQEPFGQNELNNNIRWRILYRQKGKVPPVTVYVDQYAKSNADAPLLDYTVHTIAMPGRGQNRGAFHPKISFFLAEKNQQEVLVVLCGSGNLTEAGWCKNVETFTILTLEPNVFYPHTLHDTFLNLFDRLGQLRKKVEKDSSEAEQLIIGFFAKRNRTNDTSCQLYHSGQQSFFSFLQQTVFDRALIQSVEVFSPYFNVEPNEVQWLKERCKDVRLQIPLLGEYCTLEEPVLTSYVNAAAGWYQPPPVVDRWCHSKVYLFHSADETITIIGSINLTAPGWAGLSGSAEVANMEVALLMREKTTAPLLLQKQADLSQLKYLSGFGEGEDALSAFTARHETPDIRFTIDWTNGILSWQTSRLKNSCSLKLSDRMLPLNGIERQVSLKDNAAGRNLLKLLAKNSLLHVVETVLEKEISHYYYPLQVGFAMKPFAFPFRVEDILVLWDELGKGEAITDEQLTRHIERLTESVVDESGAICQDGYVRSSLLNENARHLSSLIRLERFLFKKEQEWKLLPHYRKERCAADVRYYLLANNINTLPAYLEQLEQQMENEPGNNGRAGFLFVLLTILESQFYNWKQLSRYLHRDYFSKEELKESKQAFDDTLSRLQLFQQKIRQATQMSAAKLDWFTKEITA